ncbi:alpha/beta hydrolase [Gryllotalpicola protaetiae]|uniref:Phospholipase n=1 Tax=Gryllotalpicola protaetiae TaxID=2419771 RepID=A0A387BNK5_9MICO|nr:dienelactone hydrolase family protein [Gryllotalpicola protaetiae]AYG02620.1 phospholipase [Gryllotalpicola protaetiae]
MPAIDPQHVLWSHPADERAGRPLLVLMHGWSYDEHHLFALRTRLPDDLVVASVRSNLPEAGGFAWFPSRGNPIGDPQPAIANHAAASVVDWLTSLPRAATVGVGGFSQGGAMALQVMRLAPDIVDYAVNLAGFVVDDVQPGDAVLASRPRPVFWGHGAHDGVIPPSAVARTERWTSTHADAQVRVYAGLGHDVAGREVDDLAVFVEAHYRPAPESVRR